MSLDNLLKAYEELNLKRNALHYANYMIGWDSETEAPAGCFDVRSKMMGVLAGESYHLSTCEETKNLIYALYDEIDNLDDDMKLIIKKEKKNTETKINRVKIPVSFKEREDLRFMTALS